MSRENVALVRQAYRDWNEGKVEAMFAYLAPDFEFVTSGVVPGLRPVYHGHHGWRDFWDDYRGIWESLHIEVNEAHDVNDCVVALTTQTGRARQGLEAERQFANVWTFRAGFVSRVVAYGDWNEALEAAGLSE